MRIFSPIYLPTFLIMSISTLDAADPGPNPAGICHPLARSTDAEVWPADNSIGVPASLIWRSKGGNRGVILCLHGIQTHAAWFGPLARELRNDGWIVIAPDRRERTPARDAQMDLARKEAGGRPLLLLGTPWGSNLAGAWLAHTSRLFPHGFIELVPAT